MIFPQYFAKIKLFNNPFGINRYYIKIITNNELYFKHKKCYNWRYNFCYTSMFHDFNFKIVNLISIFTATFVATLNATQYVTTKPKK